MIGSLNKQIGKAGKQIRQAFLGLVARSSAKTLQLKGLDDEVLQDIKVIQQVGFASWIPEGAQVVIIPLDGKTSRAVVVGSTGAKVMVEVSIGETCIFDQFGNEFHLGQSGATLNCNLAVDGNITATGDVADQKSTMQAMRDTYNAHTNGNTPTPTPKM